MLDERIETTLRSMHIQLEAGGDQLILAWLFSKTPGSQCTWLLFTNSYTTKLPIKTTNCCFYIIICVHIKTWCFPLTFSLYAKLGSSPLDSSSILMKAYTLKRYQSSHLGLGTNIKWLSAFPCRTSSLPTASTAFGKFAFSLHDLTICIPKHLDLHLAVMFWPRR